MKQRWHATRVKLAKSAGGNDQRHSVVDLHAHMLLPVQSRVIPCTVCGQIADHVAFECKTLPARKKLDLPAFKSVDDSALPAVLHVHMPEIVGRSPQGRPRWLLSSPYSKSRTPRGGRPPSPLALTPRASGGGASPVVRSLRGRGGESKGNRTRAGGGGEGSSGAGSGAGAGAGAGTAAGTSATAGAANARDTGASRPAKQQSSLRGKSFFNPRVAAIRVEGNAGGGGGGGGTSPLSPASPRRRSLDSLQISARGSPKVSPASPARHSRSSRRNTLVVSVIERIKRQDSGRSRFGSQLNSPGGVDWNVPSPRAPSPTQLVLHDAQYEMSVIARAVWLLRRAVRAHMRRHPERFKCMQHVRVAAETAPVDDAAPQEDEYVCCTLSCGRPRELNPPCRVCSVLSGFLAPRTHQRRKSTLFHHPVAVATHWDLTPCLCLCSLLT